MSTKKPAEQAAFALTLQEYCIRLSTTERRVELIAGFEADERRQNRLKDTESAYKTRFQAFINRPA